jgi:hypothetical protein
MTLLQSENCCATMDDEIDSTNNDILPAMSKQCRTIDTKHETRNTKHDPNMIEEMATSCELKA